MVIACASAAFLFAAPDARADGDSARKHFEAGRRLRDAGDCARAIAEFDKSISAERSIGAYYNLGYCHEQLSHRQEAHDAYVNARQLASVKKDDRLREISGALAALMETPHIRLVLPQPLPAGTEIRVDDQLVLPAFYAAETVVFTTPAKTHTVIVTAPGYEERRETVDVKQVKPIELRRPAPKAAPPPERTPVPVSAPVDGSPKTDDGSWTWQHWAGLGLGAVGVGLFTFGSVKFISYRIDEANYGERHDQADACAKVPNTTRCADPVLEDRRRKARAEYTSVETEGRDQAPVMAGAVIAGALMIGGGILLYLTAPKSAAASSPARGWRFAPVVGADIRGATFGGTF